MTDLPIMITTLAADQPLPDKCCDHMLTGDWAGYGECHVRPNSLLVYMKKVIPQTPKSYAENCISPG